MDAERRILVVDCESNRLDAMVAALRRAGYTATGAGSFEAGRELLRARQYDVLVAALRLLPYNGLHLVIQSQMLYPVTRAIVLVEPADAWSDAEARRHGAHTLAMPADPDRLLALVSSVLDGRPIRTAAHRWKPQPIHRAL
jgi:DNA-binding NtrC family response regulator